jgi:predicted PurR-regulated permease PerM
MRYQELDNSTKIILKVFGIILALAFLWVIRDIVIVLLLSVIFASAMEPLANYFKLRRVPRAVSVLTVYVLVFLVVGSIIYLMIPPLINQLQVLGDNLPLYNQQLRERIPQIAGLTANIDAGSIGKELISSFSGNENVFSRTVGIFNGFLSFITILVVSFYLVAEQKGMRELIKSLVPSKHQDFTMNLVDKIQSKMGLWIIGQLILSISIFILTFVGLTLLGVKYALFLALVAGLLEVIPYIGPFVSAIPGIFFAFIQNPALAIAVLVLYIVVQKIEGYVLVPKVMQRTVGLPPLLVLIALLIGYKLAGVLGLLLAVPLVAAITVAVQEFYAQQDQK